MVTVPEHAEPAGKVPPLTTIADLPPLVERSYDAPGTYVPVGALAKTVPLIGDAPMTSWGDELAKLAALPHFVARFSGTASVSEQNTKTRPRPILGMTPENETVLNHV